jgi:hypothetical protein
MLKKLLFGLAIATMLVATAISANVNVNKKHKDQVGLDGSKVNCAYCHVKAKIPKEGKDFESHRTGPLCKREGCH